MKKIAIALLLVMGATTAFAARLPQTVIPKHYDLTISIDLANETFSGEETIDVDVRDAVSSITMHAVGLTVRDAQVTAAGASQPASVAVNAADETITLTTPATIATGNAQVVLKFDGKITRQLRGLYLSKTATRKYAVTQFEATDARRAFPCFDEPVMKATFDVALVIDEGDTAISNGAVVSDTPAGPGRHRVRFKTTPRMSTYLVAMLVGDFDCIEGGADGIPIRVCGPAGRAAKYGQFALSAAEESMRFYNRYYGIKYPFGKLDMIAIPDFEAGAMENAGAITYRETAIFYDPKTSTYERQKGIASTVSHEIAHMWFGDLVTMKWWDDIWLNEGFASFMTPKPMKEWKPEWNIPLSQAESTVTALSLDAQQATRPIRAAAETPAEINQLFDGIAYGKTAAVLRMLEQWIGEETFREGIRVYLTRYSWSNAAAEDFWNTMAEVSKKPVNIVMKSFVDQAGAPLLHADHKCVDGKSTISVSQERMARRGTKNEQTWSIPVCIDGGGCTVVDTQAGSIAVGPCTRALFLSDNGRGYYAVDYADDDRRALRSRLATLNDQERISIEGNEWMLVYNLRRDLADYLALLRAMPRPQSRQLIEMVTAHLEFINERLVTKANRAHWEREVRTLLRGYAPMTWTAPAGETLEQRTARANVLWAAGYIGRDPEVIAGARRVTERYLKDSSSVDANIASSALKIAAMGGDEALYSKMRERIATAPTAEVANRFTILLTEFRDPKLIASTIEYAFSDAVRSQDLPRLINAIFENPEAREAVWQAVGERWPDLQRRVPTALHRFMGSLGSFCDAKAKQSIESFFAKADATEGTRALRRALEKIDTCIAFREAHNASFQRALGAPSLGTPSNTGPDRLQPAPQPGSSTEPPVHH